MASRSLSWNLSRSIAVFLVAATTAAAQESSIPSASDMRIVPTLRTAEDTPRFWVTTEYVHYWQEKTPKLPELLSLADPTDSFPVGSYYGNKGMSWDDGNGVKLTAGAWLDTRKMIGVEVSGFYIPKQNQTNNYNLAAGNVDAFFQDYNLGSPPHIFNNFFPLDASSTANFQYSTEQYGGEANALLHLGDWEPSPGLRITANGLGGFRYFGLADTYSDQYNEPNLGYFYSDSFKTDNNFYGANVGIHARFQYASFFADVTPKIALGVTDESVDVDGSNSVPNNPGPGGFYASGNKLGHRSNVPFAYLPQITVKLGYDFNETVEAFVGYDALYLSDVARVENQISTNLDGNQMAGFNYVPGGPADQSPAQGVQSSSMFEQGVTAGITLKL